MKSATCLLAALSSFGSVLALELEAPVKLPHVPKVRNPGSDGFPTLISAQSAMTDYMQGKDSLNHHASVLGLHLKKVEKEETDKIIQQNNVYEEKLKSQEEANQVIVVGNAKLAKQIVQVRKLEDKLSTLVSQEKTLVKARRDQFAMLKRKFLEGQQRVNRVLESVEIPTLDDSSPQEGSPASFLEFAEEKGRRAPEEADLDDLEESAELSTAELQVASDTRPALTDEQRLGGQSEIERTKQAEEADEQTELSLKAAGKHQENTYSETDEQPQSTQKNQKQSKTDRKVQAEEGTRLSDAKVGLSEVESETGALVQSLAADLATLREATDKTFAKLKESFQQGYKAGARRHIALLKQESALKDSLKSAKLHALKLKAEYKHLTAKRKGLEQQLVKNGAFLGNLQKMAAGR